VESTRGREENAEDCAIAGTGTDLNSAVATLDNPLRYGKTGDSPATGTRTMGLVEPVEDAWQVAVRDSYTRVFNFKHYFVGSGCGSQYDPAGSDVNLTALSRSTRRGVAGLALYVRSHTIRNAISRRSP